MRALGTALASATTLQGLGRLARRCARVRKLKAMGAPRHLLAFATIVLGLSGLACGRNGALALAPDGGGGAGGVAGASEGAAGAGTGGGAGAAQLTSVHAFTVTSLISRVSGDAGVMLPVTQTLTLVLDADAGRAIMGANGYVHSELYRSNDSRTFQIDAGLSLQLPGGCYAPDVEYGPMTVTVTSDGQLSGESTGCIPVDPRGLAPCEDVTMVLSGGPDTDTPTLIVEDAGHAFDALTANGPVDPFVGAIIDASEPLPATPPPMVISTMGDPLALTPAQDPSVPAAGSFSTPAVLLPYGEAYTVLPNSVVDFAGNVGQTPTGFATSPEPPLVAQDGFESVTDPTLGGATVISGSGYLVITGGKSLLVPPLAYSLVPRAAKARLALRLAVPAGATKIRFSYRTVDMSSMESQIALAWASVGQTISHQTIGPANMDMTFSYVLPDQTMVDLGPVKSAELQLGAGTGAEVVFAVMDSGLGCNGDELQPRGGLVIDDLRVE
jgi:hypothetical protein